jgi:hypothetical protein
LSATNTARAAKAAASRNITTFDDRGGRNALSQAVNGVRD